MTGASRGIGRATAIALARAGASVAVGYSAHPRERRRVVATLRADHGATAVALGADLADPDGRRGARRADRRRRSAASTSWSTTPGSPATTSRCASPTTTGTRCIAIDLTAAFHICRAALRPMLRQRFGRIVNVSSISGRHRQRRTVQLLGREGGAHRAHQVARARGCEPRHHRQRGGPRVHRDRDDHGARATRCAPRRSRRSPRRRMGTADEVASAIAFLVMPEVRVHHRSRAPCRRRPRGVTESEAARRRRPEPRAGHRRRLGTVRVAPTHP